MGNREAGRRIWTAMMGAEHVNKLRSPDGATQKLMSLAEETCWGDIWLRPNLGLRERSLVTLALLVAQDKPAELARHVRGALANGCTADEIMEVAVHCSAYTGLPAAIAGANTMSTALGYGSLAELGQDVTGSDNDRPN
jgi:4-carboxymuconolactone decarboxylase